MADWKEQSWSGHTCLWYSSSEQKRTIYTSMTRTNYLHCLHHQSSTQWSKTFVRNHTINSLDSSTAKHLANLVILLTICHMSMSIAWPPTSYCALVSLSSLVYLTSSMWGSHVICFELTVYNNKLKVTCLLDECTYMMIVLVFLRCGHLSASLRLYFDIVGI